VPRVFTARGATGGYPIKFGPRPIGRTYKRREAHAGTLGSWRRSAIPPFCANFAERAAADNPL